MFMKEKITKSRTVISEQNMAYVNPHLATCRSIVTSRIPQKAGSVRSRTSHTTRNSFQLRVDVHMHTAIGTGDRKVVPTPLFGRVEENVFFS